MRRHAVDAVPVWLAVVGVLVAVYLVLPSFIVVPMSFDGGISFQFPPTQFSTKQYENFFTNPVWLKALGNSFLVAALTSVVATAIGTAAAVGLHNLTGRLAGFVRTLLMVSVVTPAIVVAIAVYIAFLQWHLVGTLVGFVLAHTALAVPFVLVSVTAALGGFDARLLRASASLGASPLSTFRRVTMPLISRGIVTGAIFAFVTSFDEVVIAVFLHSPLFQTLPVQMYNSVISELDPTIAAASSLVLVSVTVVVLLPLLIRRKARH
jgi:putative spermidine/putrescine transport system permease protein